MNGDHKTDNMEDQYQLIFEVHDNLLLKLNTPAVQIERGVSFVRVCARPCP